jgi:hypothetical protein
VNQNGATITGYYAELLTSAGSKISTGYTTNTFTDVIAGTNYEIELDGYSTCAFENWQGTTNSGDMSFTQANGPMTFVGVFDCTSSGAVGLPFPFGLVLSAVSQLGIPVGFLAAALW